MLIKKIYKNENSDILIDIVEKILDFNKHQKGKGSKIPAPKQIPLLKDSQ